MSKGIRCYDRTERTIRIVCNTDILRDACQVLDQRGHTYLAYRIVASPGCAGRHPMSDADVEIPVLDLPFVERAVALVA